MSIIVRLYCKLYREQDGPSKYRAADGGSLVINRITVIQVFDRSKWIL